MPEIMLRNMPTDQLRRMPDNVFQGNINLTNLPANPRPQYTGLVDPALAASPLADSQLVEDPRSWSSLGNRAAGTAAGLLLGKAAGAALSPKLIGSLAAMAGGIQMPGKGGGLRRSGTPTNPIVKTDGPTARQQMELNEIAEASKANAAASKANAAASEANEEKLLQEMLHGKTPETGTTIDGIHIADEKYNTGGINKDTADVNAVVYTPNNDVYDLKAPEPGQTPNGKGPRGLQGASIRKAGDDANNVRMSLPQIKYNALNNSFFRAIKENIERGSYGDPTNEKLFKDHSQRVLYGDKNTSGLGIHSRMYEVDERNRKLLGDINNSVDIRTYLNALSPGDEMFTRGKLRKTETGGQLFYDIKTDGSQKTVKTSPQSSGNYIIGRLKNIFPNATDWDNYNKGINETKLISSRKLADEIANSPEGETVKLIQATNPLGATIPRYNVSTKEMSVADQADSINRQHHVRFNGDEELYRVSSQRLKREFDPATDDMGTDADLVRPRGQNKFNISDTKKGWQLGRVMVKKSTSLNPETPKESVMWTTSDGKTHTKHVKDMTRGDTNEFVEYYNNNVSPETSSGKTVRGYTQIFGLGGAAAGAALMAPPDTSRAPERY